MKYSVASWAPLTRRLGIKFSKLKYSTATKSDSVKEYAEIVEEMKQRSMQRYAFNAPRLKNLNFDDNPIKKERYRTLKCGDLVIMNLEPFVVIKTPESPMHNYVIANRVGKAKEVSIGSIDALLMTLVPESLFTTPGSEIYAPEDTVSAPLGVVESDKIREQDVPQPVTRVVNFWLYGLISKPLSDIFEKASERAQFLFPKVSQKMRELQESNTPVVIPFFDFIRKITDKEVSIVDYYAAAICLDHSSLRHGRVLKQSYLGVDALQILPKDSEKRNADILKYSNNPTEVNKFLHDYAARNLPDGEFESRALELVREKKPQMTYVDHAITAEILSSETRFYRSSNWYNWIFANRPELPFSQSDLLSGIREEYHHPVYCVDDIGAHEIDDGISLEKLETPGCVRLGIHIANPTSAFDIRVHLSTLLPHSSSVYLHDKTLKLLPDSFSDYFSLKSGGASLSLFVDLNKITGSLSNVQIKPLILKSVHYKQPIEMDSKDYEEVARILLKKRIKEGMVMFKDYLNPNLGTVDLSMKILGKGIVTEFMVLANHLVAEYAVKNNIPLLFRTQSMLLQSHEIKQLYTSKVSKGEGLIDLSWRSVIRRSHVSVSPNRHDGMGVTMATRFTSPLRRVEDLITHHQLQSSLLKNGQGIKINDLDNMCERLLLSESLVKSIQRDDAKYVSLTELKPNSEVLGVVLRVGNYHETLIHLPQYKIDAYYTGEKVLDPYSIHNFRVINSSPSGGYATVDII